jgi:hypothetical protein
LPMRKRALSKIEVQPVVDVAKPLASGGVRRKRDLIRQQEKIRPRGACRMGSTTHGAVTPSPGDDVADPAADYIRDLLARAEKEITGAEGNRDSLVEVRPSSTGRNNVRPAQTCAGVIDQAAAESVRARRSDMLQRFTGAARFTLRPFPKARRSAILRARNFSNDLKRPRL